MQGHTNVSKLGYADAALYSRENGEPPCNGGTATTESRLFRDKSEPMHFSKKRDQDNMNLSHKARCHRAHCPATIQGPVLTLAGFLLG
ncbi:hypothetical protein SBOR_8333 [Sclerotinia borealis F-4128]|uniref:Uncharacterized protein n=1 Tax=Sclerotinia borealis (strain F-4128) TaxID=1432307 RepID=W9C8Y4_SCLBF|nr:hypothetical protein SBOR_8333 [Sclerotinia borealis F-4128]